MNELLTWQSLSTYAGATLATGVITQFVKELGILKRIPTRLVSYGIAAVLLLLATAFTGGFTLPRMALAPINAALVSLASNGAYDAMNAKNTYPKKGAGGKNAE